MRLYLTAIWVFLHSCLLNSVIAQTSSLDEILEITNTETSLQEKEQQLHYYLNNNTILPDELAVIYYILSKWYWNQKEKNKGKSYAIKEHELRVVLKDTNKLKKNLYNLGFMSCRLPIPDYATSLNYYDMLISISQEIESRLGSAYREKGDIYDNLGDFQRALENYYNSERIFKKIDNQGRLLKTYINISATYANLRDSVYLNPFLNNQKKIDTLLKKITISKSQQAKIWVNLGNMYMTTKNPSKALAPYEKALTIIKELNNKELIFTVLNNIGVIYTKIKNYDKAKLYFDESNLYKENLVERKSSLYNNLADWNLRQGMYTKATENYQNAIASLLNTKYNSIADLPTLEQVKKSPYKKDILSYLIDKSNALSDWYENYKNKEYLKLAGETNILADAIIDLLYFNSEERLSKLFWREKGATLYHNAVSVCYELNDPHKALYYMEKNKGLLLLENINEIHAKKQVGVPAYIIDQEYRLVGEIKKWERLLNTPISQDQNSISKDSIKNHVFLLKNKHKALIDSLENKYPVYSSLKRNINIKSSQEILASITDKEYAISYILGKQDGFVMLISKNGLELKKLRQISLLNVKIRQFRKMIEKPFITNQEYLEFQKIATNLYQLLFPFKELSTYSQDTTIRIIPDGILHTIPFEALTVTNTKPIEKAYLLEKYNIYYNYSLSIDSQLSLLTSPENNKAAAFFITNYKDNYLSSLPKYKSDKNDIIQEKYQLFFDAANTTKSAFLKTFNSHNILHISTHGGLENETPWLGFYDEKLFLDELYTQKKQKEIVVLSACKTAVGKQKMGEGIFNLTRGFINAGAKTVIATLWNINEKANTHIMSSFYKEINNNVPKATALQNAKRIYLNEHIGTSEASPYYWSGIISTGNNEILFAKKSTWYYYLIILLIIPFILFLKPTLCIRKFITS